METLMFYVLAVITVVSAFFVVTLQRPVHNVLFMILTMLGLAGLFVILHAEFVAMVQIIVYAGAVMVLFLFVIMLLNLDVSLGPLGPRATRWWVGMGLAIGFAVLLIPLLAAAVAPAGPKPLADAAAAGLSNTQIIGRELFTTYLLPFEIASVLLLAAMIGAAMLTKKKS